MDLRNFLTNRASASRVEAISTAMAAAEAAGAQTRLAHVSQALLADSSVRTRIPTEIRLRAEAAVAEQLDSADEQAQPSGELGTFAFDLSLLSKPAVELAQDWGADKVSPLAFLAAILSVEGIGPASAARTQEALRSAGLTLSRLMPSRDSAGAVFDFTYKSLGLGVDITAKARSGFWPTCPLVGMERELRRLVMLMSSGSDSVVVVGGPGVGKTAIIQGLAWHIANATRPLIPAAMDACTIVSISAVDIIAGTGARGELENRLDQMLAFFRNHPLVIPFFDEVHTLLETDDPNARAVATALKPPMANGQFRCIGSTTDKEYARFIASDQAMNSRFTRLLLPEPDADATARIIQGALGNLLSPWGHELGVVVSDDAIRAAVRLTGRYQRNDCQPRKSIRLIQSALAEKIYRLQTEVPNVEPRLTAGDMAETFSDVSGIPVDDLDEGRNDYYQQLSSRLRQRVRGQGEAIDGVTEWLALQACGWLDPSRPRGRFLFLGPPGVGKTELAITLAEQVMHDRGSMITRNMGEYKGEGARSRFMGSDPGYIGFGQVSTIYSEVMMRPYSVVVLDEFEKAHPSLSDPLISVLDGMGADAQGRRTDFSQCIFVMTSNAIHGADAVEEDRGEDRLREYLRGLGGIWTAPLIDRIDRVVLFQPLSEAVLLEILDAMIIQRRSAARRALPPELDDPAARHQILAWATEGEGAASARRLERALLRWLTRSRKSSE